jgi:hypothetical protein
VAPPGTKEERTSLQEHLAFESEDATLLGRLETADKRLELLLEHFILENLAERRGYLAVLLYT